MRPSNKSRSRNKSGNLGSNPNNNGNSSNNNNSNNNNRQRLGNIINRVFESAGPDGKVRGTPQQIIDKYQALARDAQLAGDRVAAESFLQHSEHYGRMLGEAQAQQNETRQVYERDDGPREDSRRDDPIRPDGYADGPRPRLNEQPQPQPQIQPQPQYQSLNQQSQRRPQHQPQPMIASSLTTIDPDDGDFGGLIETPESAALPPLKPVPVAAANGALNGAHHAAFAEVVTETAPETAAVAAAEPKEPVKRSRVRRKASPPDGEPSGVTDE